MSVCVCVCVCVCVFFKQVWLNKIESLLFGVVFSFSFQEILYFFVTILKFVDDFPKGAICVIPSTFSLFSEPLWS